jgi:hypothetical protein
MIRTSQKNQKADIRTRFKNKPIQRIKLSLFNPGSVSREGEKRITSSLLLKYVIIKPRTCQRFSSINSVSSLILSDAVLFRIFGLLIRSLSIDNFSFLLYDKKDTSQLLFLTYKEKKTWQAEKMPFPSCPSMN